MNSVNNEYADRCVDCFVRDDGSYGCKEFRRDPEDQGAWFVTVLNQTGVYRQYEDALRAALTGVPWLGEAIKCSPPFVP